MRSCLRIYLWRLTFFSQREREREREGGGGGAQSTASHLITHVFKYVFVTLSILQSQFMENRFRKTEHSEHTGVLLLLLFTLGVNETQSEHRRGQEQRGGTTWALIAKWFVLLQRCSSTVAIRTLPLWLCSAQLMKQQLVKYASCFALAGSPPP